ncbi:uncharacterized protein N0V89_010368 [Didymosphaeria variabile]|uniref:Uncharacterized protein n=1 Tax=Didymosphaeria variabile TaxID=1932322 RepID=A0A9W8XCM6_9PLEO|nr:uncharacterized protein N0V89_010368 [Didymosphaeria variabile]KAJ4346439.1 hypothetical protein N0V89_010368 [Didymosphaeria variabile]
MHENPSWIIVSKKATADIGYEALIPAVVLTALALLTIILRWYSRAKLSGVYGVEDVIVTLALIFSMAFTGIVGGEFSIDLNSTHDEVKASLFTTIMKARFHAPSPSTSPNDH